MRLPLPQHISLAIINQFSKEIQLLCGINHIDGMP